MIRISSIFGWKHILNSIFCVNESVFCDLPIVISKQKQKNVIYCFIIMSYEKWRQKVQATFELDETLVKELREKFTDEQISESVEWFMNETIGKKEFLEELAKLTKSKDEFYQRTVVLFISAKLLIAEDQKGHLERSVLFSCSSAFIIFQFSRNRCEINCEKG